MGESSIFKSSARYLCVSKTEGDKKTQRKQVFNCLLIAGLPNFVVQDLRVLNDKTNLPQGFSLIDKTADTAQKPWKKKQLCYCLGNQRVVKTAVTNIIVCSRVKKAPPGFSFAGEVRGITICYKMGNVQEGEAKPTPPERPPRPTSMSPGSNPMYPSLGESDHDYEILKPGPMGPSRPAPPRPPTVPVVPHQNSTHTLNNTYSSLDGVPFIVNPKFLSNSSDNRVRFRIFWKVYL